MYVVHNVFMIIIISFKILHLCISGSICSFSPGICLRTLENTKYIKSIKIPYFVWLKVKKKITQKYKTRSPFQSDTPTAAAVRLQLEEVTAILEMGLGSMRCPECFAALFLGLKVSKNILFLLVTFGILL